MAKIGIYGGSFNPVHIAHLLQAREALELLGLDRVIFIPAAQNPLKSAADQAPAEHRLAMLELALEGEPGFALDARELHRPGPSYTVDTLRELKAELPADTCLYLILGQDQLPALHRWRDFPGILDLATPVLVPRSQLPGAAALATGHPLLEGREVHWLRRVFDLSATEVRNRVASGQNIRYLVPDKVAEYIRQFDLYNTL